MELKFKLMPTSFKFLKGQVRNQDLLVSLRAIWFQIAQRVSQLVAEIIWL